MAQGHVLLTANKKGFSGKEIQKQLGPKRYEPLWAMGKRDDRYTLEDMIELDEGCFTVGSSELEQDKGIRGRGAAGKQNVAIMAGSTVLEDIETGKAERQCRYFGARVLGSHKAGEIDDTPRGSIDEKSIVFTDQSIADFVELHITEKSNKETTKETL